MGLNPDAVACMLLSVWFQIYGSTFVILTLDHENNILKIICLMLQSNLEWLCSHYFQYAICLGSICVQRSLSGFQNSSDDKFAYVFCFSCGELNWQQDGECAKKGTLSGLVFLVFGSYDYFMSALIFFFYFSCYFFSFFGVPYCQFFLTACKLVKKQIDQKFFGHIHAI